MCAIGKVVVGLERSGELDRSYLHQQRGEGCFSRASNMAGRVSGVELRPVSSKQQLTRGVYQQFGVGSRIYSGVTLIGSI